MKRYVSTSAKQYMSCYEQFAALDRLSKKQIWNANVVQTVMKMMILTLQRL